jgi:hypothetical protein
VLTRGEIYGQSGIYKLANFSLRNWDPGIHKLALQMDSGYCLIAKILDSQWSSSDEHRGASSAGYSVAWGQTTFWRGGSVTPGPWALRATKTWPTAQITDQHASSCTKEQHVPSVKGTNDRK